MAYNKNGMSLREGHLFIDGIEVLDNVKAELKFTPEIWNGRLVGDKTDSTRWVGYSINGTITRRRSTSFVRDIIKDYMDTGITPEFTLQGINNDPNSDYVQEHGNDDVTVVGCVPTSDLLLLAQDANGDMVEDAITFKAKSIV